MVARPGWGEWSFPPPRPGRTRFLKIDVHGFRCVRRRRTPLHPWLQSCAPPGRGPFEIRGPHAEFLIIAFAEIVTAECDCPRLDFPRIERYAGSSQRPRPD